MERSGLVYTLIVIAIVFLAFVRARLDKRPGWKAFFDSAGKLEIGLLALLLGSLIFFGCLQILLRNFFHRGIIWADPLMRHIVLWLGCLGGVMATSRLRHISIDIFSRFLPARLLKWRDSMVYLATAAAGSVLGMAALRLVVDEKAFGEEGFLGLDVWTLQLILPVAFFLIAYRSVLNLFLAAKAKPIDWEEIDPASATEP